MTHEARGSSGGPGAAGARRAAQPGQVTMAAAAAMEPSFWKRIALTPPVRAYRIPATHNHRAGVSEDILNNSSRYARATRRYNDRYIAPSISASFVNGGLMQKSDVLMLLVAAALLGDAAIAYQAPPAPRPASKPAAPAAAGAETYRAVATVQDLM